MATHQINANMHFVFASDTKKKEIMQLFKEYKHNASKWHYAKRKEVEEELRHYGLIDF